MGALKRGDSVDQWHDVGLALLTLQVEAMSVADTNQPIGKAYNAAWQSLAAHVPHLRDLDKTTRSHAMWMSSDWPKVELSHKDAAHLRFATEQSKHPGCKS
jgi:hypothetical protein